MDYNYDTHLYNAGVSFLNFEISSPHCICWQKSELLTFSPFVFHESE